jgi:phospholipase C
MQRRLPMSRMPAAAVPKTPAMPRRPKRRYLALAGIASIAAAPGLASAASTGHATAAGGLPDVPIKHVIEIMIENHTFDNLFGSFPGADGIPANTAPNVSPAWAGPNEGDVMSALNNSAAVEQKAMDYQPGKGYQMDHYTGMAPVTEFGPQFDPNEQYLARSYELADHNFQPVIAPTQPNVMTALNGTDHGWVYNNRQPGATQPWNSIFDELTARGRTWKIYYALPPSALSGTIWGQIIPSGHPAGLTTGNAFFSDLSSGSLPEFSFVRPGVGYSTEAEEDIGEGDAWVGQLVNAVAHSRYWDSTAIFVTYDEGGGFWDHVAPPVSPGYGTRTPTIIVSPYARRGVFHQQTTNVSILSFMQHLWGLAPLTRLNARQNDLMSAFSFRQKPLPAPDVPVAPADTIAFHGTGGILTDIGAPKPGRPLTVNLEAETGGLSLDSAASGPVNLTVTPPSGVAVPAGFPSSVTLAGGQANFTVRFPTAGYYRIAAAGPDGSKGWVTVDVGVNPNTAP